MANLYRVKVFTFQDGWVTRLHAVTLYAATIAADTWVEDYGSQNVIVDQISGENNS